SKPPTKVSRAAYTTNGQHHKSVIGEYIERVLLLCYDLAPEEIAAVRQDRARVREIKQEIRLKPAYRLQRRSDCNIAGVGRQNEELPGRQVRHNRLGRQNSVDKERPWRRP